MNTRELNLLFASIFMKKKNLRGSNKNESVLKKLG
jgi:hypothetical protein